MTARELTALMALIGSIIAGWIFLDTRHEPAGASDRSRIESQIYTLDVTIADLTSTIGRYNAQEESGNLSEANRVRRSELERLRDHYTDERRALQDSLNAF